MPRILILELAFAIALAVWGHVAVFRVFRNSRIRDWGVALWLMIGVSFFSAISPVITSLDSIWTVYIAMRLFHSGDTNLDEYADALERTHYYAIECVSPDGSVSPSGLGPCRGHNHSLFPAGGAALTAPLIVPIVYLGKLAGSMVTVSDPNLGALLRGDFDTAHPLIEKVVASILLGATAMVIFFIARTFLVVKGAVVLALIFALSTSAYSVAGRALWQHAPSMLLVALTVLFLLKAEKWPALAAWAGLPVALSYTVRPTDSLFVLIITAYVAVKHRAQLRNYLLAALPVAVVFVAYNYAVYHVPLSPYYRSKLDGFLPSNWPRMAIALAGNLISPSRGLFVFTPVFLFAIWSMWKGMWQASFAKWLVVLVCAHTFVISAFMTSWWAGHSYGPRYFTDLTPVLVLFLIPYLKNWATLSRLTQIAFVACTLTGLAIHLRGGWFKSVHLWNDTPVDVDFHPQRNWDWSDPPFLR